MKPEEIATISAINKLHIFVGYDERKVAGDFSYDLKKPYNKDDLIKCVNSVWKKYEKKPDESKLSKREILNAAKVLLLKVIGFGNVFDVFEENETEPSDYRLGRKKEFQKAPWESVLAEVEGWLGFDENSIEKSFITIKQNVVRQFNDGVFVDQIVKPFVEKAGLGNVSFTEEKTKSFDSLYDLALVPCKRRINEKKEKKYKPNLFSYPPKKNQRFESAFYLDRYGEKSHVNFFTLTNGKAIGWSIFSMKPGIFENIEETLEGQQEFLETIASSFSVGESEVNESIINGNSVESAPKEDKFDRKWIDIQGCSSYSGKNNDHDIKSIDFPFCEFGVQGKGVHEYFITNGDVVNGTLRFVRFGSVDEANGVVEPKWKSFIAEDPLPLALCKDGMDYDLPQGVSAIPKSLMALVPEQYRYWEFTGKKSKDTRKALIESEYFNKANVVVTGGRYRRKEETKSYSTPSIQKARKNNAVFGIVETTAFDNGDPVSKEQTLVIQGKKVFSWKSSNAIGDMGIIKPVKLQKNEIPFFLGNEEEKTKTEKGDFEKVESVVIDSGKAFIEETSGGFNAFLQGKEKDFYGTISKKKDDVWVSKLTSTKNIEPKNLVAYLGEGPMIVECPSCDSRNFEKSDGFLVCEKCGTKSKIDATTRYCWEYEKKWDEMPFVVGFVYPETVEGQKTKSTKRPIMAIKKGDSFEGYFYGIVLKPNDGVDGPLEPDTDNEIYNASEIDSAIKYNAKVVARIGQTDRIQHQIGATNGWGFDIIRNEKAPVDYWLGRDGQTSVEKTDWRKGGKSFQKPFDIAEFIPKGTWLREGFARGPKLREAIRTGEINAWSVEGISSGQDEEISTRISVA